MQAKKEEKRRKSALSKPLLSHSTILILSAFLVGIAAGKAPNAQVEVMLYLTSICGVIAYFVLGRVANKRRRLAEQRQQEQAAQQLAIRVGRHIPQPRQTSDRSMTERAGIELDQQCQPVGSSQ